jgi:AraC-like DNA-binding protein
MHNPNDLIENECAAHGALRIPNTLYELTQLSRGAFRGTPEIQSLGGILIGKICVGHAFLHRIRAPEGFVSVVITGGPSTTMHVGGYRLAPEDCIVLRSGAEVEAMTQGDSETAFITVSERIWGDDGRRISRGLALGRGALSMTCDGRSISALWCRLGAALRMSVRAAETGDAWRRRTVAAGLIGQLKRVAEGAADVGARPRGRTRRQMGVELARRFIREHLHDPIRLADLCGHTHLRPRALEYGFREILDLSPMCYIKILRLNVVHRQLLDAPHEPRSISELALDAGFRHLSQFAVDYKAHFLESPSATRRRIATTLVIQRPPARTQESVVNPARPAPNYREISLTDSP